jgi:hypothetical protein
MHEVKKFNPNVHILFQRTFHKSENHRKTNDVSQRGLLNV